MLSVWQPLDGADGAKTVGALFKPATEISTTQRRAVAPMAMVCPIRLLMPARLQCSTNLTKLTESIRMSAWFNRRVDLYGIAR
jgi:hypothetical protein